MNHRLNLSYEEYSGKNFSIVNCQIDKYIIFEKIGGGSYGQVFKAINDQTKTMVAVKVIDLVAIEKDSCSERVKEIRRRLAQTQAQIMARLDSPHIAKCFDIYQNNDLKIIVMEYCGQGTLYDAVFRKGKISEEEAVGYLKQMIMGLAEMHKKYIIHRDLKSENIMIHNNMIKIIDMGFSKILTGDGLTQTPLGTITTMAPEIIIKEKYGLKADIWSLGIIFYEMIFGTVPFKPARPSEMYANIKGKDLFAHKKIRGVEPSKNCFDLLKRMLQFEPKKRLDWKGLLEHQIFINSGDLAQEYYINRDISVIMPMQEGFLVCEQDFIKVIENLEIQKQKKQQNEIPKPLKSLNSKAVEMKRKQIVNDGELLQWARQKYIECLKTEFILKQIINPIEDQKLLKIDSRKNTEFMFLLSSRCFQNMSFLNEEAKLKNHEIVQGLAETVRYLYDLVKKKFTKYDSQLVKQQEKVSSVIADKWNSVFNKQVKELKDSLLNGLEKYDYKKEEHIKFTYTDYIKDYMIERIGEDNRISKYLSKYVQINLLTTEDLKNKKFLQVVQEIISK